MSENSESLRRKMASAGDLQGVVRIMKALAASGIGQYEKSLPALAEYYRTVALGLGACFRQRGADDFDVDGLRPSESGSIGAIIFGSDQGLVGRFNEVVADYAMESLASLKGELRIWAVGARVHGLLADAGLPMAGLFTVPNSVQAIVPLVGRIQVESEAQRGKRDDARVFVFHNRPRSTGLYEPVCQRLLPLDAAWRQGLAELPWPTNIRPQVLGAGLAPLPALVREYLFISLFRACAESLASENASRLSAMERADRNIGELLEGLRAGFHRLRQGAIDEELFDVVAGFEALADPP
jgi:F-type H+-transporting ATPase subunit gamma